MSDAVSLEIVQAWVRLNRAQTRVMARVEAALKAAGMPPLAWYDVLWALERAERLRPAELQDRLLLSQYNLSRLLDRMARDGLLRRLPHAEDARGQWVAATADGVALRRRMWPVYAGALAEAFGGRLTAEEAAGLAALLDRI